MKKVILFFTLVISIKTFSQSNLPVIEKELSKSTLLNETFYKKLHASPELSTMEANTSSTLKKEMASLGFEIIDSLGFYSFAAILKNGNGPVILYRTEMDGLPVKEQTELPFASTVSQLKNGESNPVMHACGHDLHMTMWLGTAKILSQLKNQWSGTLVMLAQSAEEVAQGAKKVVTAPNFLRVPKADIQLAVHDKAEVPAGQIGFCDNYAMAAVDMMNITIYGKGGHGALPHQTIDPILLSAQYITAIQSIVSRNISPNEPAVVTVGAIHGGNIGNVIPDQVTLKLTIRSFNPAVRKIILERLKTIGDNLALAAGLSNEMLPKYDLLDMSIPSVLNNEKLGATLRSYIEKTFGAQSTTTLSPVTIGEDFGVYGQQTDSIPSYILFIGTLNAEKRKSIDSGKEPLYNLHSSHFAPDYQTTIPIGIKVMTSCILHQFGKRK